MTKQEMDKIGCQGIAYFKRYYGASWYYDLGDDFRDDLKAVSVLAELRNERFSIHFNKLLNAYGYRRIQRNKVRKWRRAEIPCVFHHETGYPLSLGEDYVR